ncbi:hypothetical protein JF66_03905 [Cryobacterium sp. MLB-32]|uniref:DMT family transporter n=1 Tax=Cryobacterium sp. MLB-32 TaxID=1529318 RepID=UPI0004E66CC6|nr:DMT family transporter [Cryobacterium sp. MLB-32]KFF60508.1 hypothetical protein JF66_03905 [Cryobacterium sp. MLB-32]
MATREALTVLAPQDLTTLRYLGGALILGLYLLATKQGLSLKRRDMPRMLAVGACGYAGYGLLIGLGQTTVPAGTTSLLLNISPVFAFILGYFVLVERTTALGYLGMLVAVLGVVTITLGDTNATGFNGNALLIVGAALLLSIFLIVQQPLFARVPPVEIVFWGCAVGGLATLPLATFQTTSANISASFWVAIVVLVVLSTVLGYSFWNVTLARTSVAEGGSLLLVVPIISVLLGWLVLGEVPTVAAIIGGSAALVGVVMLSRATSRREQAGPGLLTGAIPVIGVLTGAIPLIGLPLVREDRADLTVTADDIDDLHEIATEAAQAVGSQLVTVSLWRPDSADLVRVYSSRPHVYQVGGISTDLGGDWLQQCVLDQRSYLADGGGGIHADAFEHSDGLDSLELAAAVNAVVADEGEFLGCINFLDAEGAYSEASLAVADQFAPRLIPVLRHLRMEQPEPVV